MRLATTLAVAITYKYKSKSGIQQIRSFARILPGSYSPTANSEVKLCPASQRQCKPCIFFGSLTGRLGWIDGRTKARRELLPPRTGARHGSSSPVFRERGKAWEASRGGGGGGAYGEEGREKRNRALHRRTVIPSGKSRRFPIFTSIACGFQECHYQSG